MSQWLSLGVGSFFYLLFGHLYFLKMRSQMLFHSYSKKHKWGVHPPCKLSKYESPKGTHSLRLQHLRGEGILKQAESSDRKWLTKVWSFIPRTITFSLQMKISEICGCTENQQKTATESENTTWLTSVWTEKKLLSIPRNRKLQS